MVYAGTYTQCVFTAAPKARTGWHLLEPETHKFLLLPVSPTLWEELLGFSGW